MVNPAYRTLNSQVRTLTTQRNRLNARFGAMNLEEGLPPKAIKTFERRKGELREEIDGLSERIAAIKAERKDCAPPDAIDGILQDRQPISKDIAKHLARRFHLHAEAFL